MEYREADALLKAMAAKVAATAKELTTLSNIPGFAEALAAHLSDAAEVDDEVASFLSGMVETLTLVSDNLNDIEDSIALDQIVDDEEDYDEDLDEAQSSPTYKVRAILGL